MQLITPGEMLGAQQDEIWVSRSPVSQVNPQSHLILVIEHPLPLVHFQILDP